MSAMSIDYMPINLEREPLFEREESARNVYYLSKSAVEMVRADGPRWKYYNSRIIADELERPLAVFSGLHREGYHDGLCYSSKPFKRYTEKRKLEETTPGNVFLIFTTSRFVIFDWEFRTEMPGANGFPINWRTDFEECIWSLQ